MKKVPNQTNSLNIARRSNDPSGYLQEIVSNSAYQSLTVFEQNCIGAALRFQLTTFFQIHKVKMQPLRALWSIEKPPEPVWTTPFVYWEYIYLTISEMVRRLEQCELPPEIVSRCFEALELNVPCSGIALATQHVIPQVIVQQQIIYRTVTVSPLDPAIYYLVPVFRNLVLPVLAGIWFEEN